MLLKSSKEIPKTQKKMIDSEISMHERIQYKFFLLSYKFFYNFLLLLLLLL